MDQSLGGRRSRRQSDRANDPSDCANQLAATRRYDAAVMAFDGRILNGIGVLGAVVETRSFARASKAMGLTPSGVSRAIARLEERLGVRLLQRTARSVALTEEGRRFYESVRPLMQGIEDAAEEAAGSRALAKGILRVAVDSLVARVVIGPRTGAFLRAHPALDLDLVVRDHLGDLVGDGFDCAVRFGDPEPSTLVAKKLTDTRVVTLEERGRPNTLAISLGTTPSSSATLRRGAPSSGFSFRTVACRPSHPAKHERSPRPIAT